ncbi:MAG TPA: OmpH family outer membrane protein [Smithella sp.]|nr:OmpH family outer membrane protein [Smithella sp.]
MKRTMKGFVLSWALVLAVALGLVAAPAGIAAEGNLKIGFVDVGKIMRDSKAAKDARAIYQKDLEAKKAILKEKSDKAASLEKDLKNAGQNSPGLKEKREKLAQEIKELKRLESDFNEQLKKKDIEMTQKILADVQNILKQIAKNENYSMIFERRSALIASEGLDITDKVIKLYDAQKK